MQSRRNAICPIMAAVMAALAVFFGNAGDTVLREASPAAGGGGVSTNKVQKTDEAWRAQLSDDQYRVTRCGGTERPFSGAYYRNKGDGVYRCVCCGSPLFDSTTKFESGTGWPSFMAPVAASNVVEQQDRSLGMARVEVICSTCNAHLGHVFPDGPKPTGLRYCINSAALKWESRPPAGSVGQGGQD